MKSSLLTNLFLSSTTILSWLFLNINIPNAIANPLKTANKQSTKPSVEYRCIDRNGTPATVAYTTRGPIELIVWKSDYFSRSGYTPERRCREVTSRFQQHSDAKNLRYISTGTINNYKAICVSEKSGGCQSNGLLITLQHNDNPEQVMRDLFNLAARESSGGIYRPAIPGIAIKEIIDVDKFLAESPLMEQQATIPDTNPEPDSTHNDPSGGTVIENPLENL